MNRVANSSNAAVRSLPFCFSTVYDQPLMAPDAHIFFLEAGRPGKPRRLHAGRAQQRLCPRLPPDCAEETLEPA